MASVPPLSRVTGSIAPAGLRLAGGYPYAFAGNPCTARAFAGGYPYSSAGSPRPARASVGIPIHSLPAAPTPPAPPALLPRPLPWAGAVLAISGEQPYPGWSRWATVPGSSPGSPHMLDRGDIAIGGGGPRGGGTSSPSPVSHAPDTLLLASPIPPGLQPAGYPYTPPTPPPLPSPDLQLSGPGCKKKWVPPGNLAGNGAGYDVCCFPKVERLDWCVPAT